MEVHEVTWVSNSVSGRVRCGGSHPGPGGIEGHEVSGFSRYDHTRFEDTLGTGKVVCRNGKQEEIGVRGSSKTVRGVSWSRGQGPGLVSRTSRRWRSGLARVLGGGELIVYGVTIVK